ncbi:reverse transcriptase domain-containing protein [Trichonephila clavata]|uniref:Reverse transcriptase domain-containing protein n=1 Tax=Trichonephila clavata TaxID=2740835 RepID=A0A8X6GD62_TRICU|nr:reverse transcriptase domain-containing protein [Trichonephila clavata]
MLTVHTFQSERPTKHVYPNIRIRVKRLISNKEIIIEALETKQLSCAHISIPGKEVRERIERLDEYLVVVETIFGFCIHGSVSEDKDNVETSVSLVVSKESISDQLNQFWQLENLGIEVEEDIQDISENDILKSFKSSIEYTDGYAKENIIESVIETPKLQGSHPTFYLPHTCVKRLDKTTTKIRIVFDGSSHGENQLSLNDCLNSGVNLNPYLLELILKFRENPTAYTVDIEKAFLQIELHEQDRDVARFFWTENLNDYGPKNLQVYWLTRVLFGLTLSPFMLAGTIRYHLKKYQDKFPDTAKK